MINNSYESEKIFFDDRAQVILKKMDMEDYFNDHPYEFGKIWAWAVIEKLDSNHEKGDRISKVAGMMCLRKLSNKRSIGGRPRK